MRILLEVTTALTSLLDLDEVLGETLDRIMALTDATAGTLILVDTDGMATRKISMRHGVPYRVSAEVLEKVMTAGLAGWVCRHGDVASVGDTLDDERWLHLPHDLYKHRSALVVPVKRHGMVHGVFTLTHVDPHHFDADLQQLMCAIADQAAIAVENARLFGEVQRLATTDGLTRLYNRRHFFELGQAEVDSEARPLCAILADIDHFKSVNDTWGHAAGDEVLHAVPFLTCKEGNPPRDKAVLTDCAPGQTQLHDVANRYVKYLKSLKPAGWVSVLAISGPPHQYTEVGTKYVRGSKYWYVKPTCTNMYQDGDPGFRLRTFAKGFKPNGFVHDICVSNYKTAMKNLFAGIKKAF